MEFFDDWRQIIIKAWVPTMSDDYVLIEHKDGSMVEYREAVHAHWIETEDLAGNHYIECSRCHWDFWLEGETAKQAELLHCPRCGAIMDEEVG